jgi:hypothetical protein
LAEGQYISKLSGCVEISEEVATSFAAFGSLVKAWKPQLVEVRWTL